MGHIHPVYDTDSHFSINPITREIKNESSAKIRLIQHDHNSERFSFDIPKMIEGHDMTTCNVIQVHYINIDSQTKEDKRGIYEVDDMQVKQDDEDTACFSWLISGNATKFSGSLNFLIRFCCVTGDSVDYAWNTELHTGISVSNGLYNGEEIAEDYSDILEQWREELFGSGGGSSTPGKDGREIEIRNNGTAIQWRYEGDSDWTDLVLISDITGEKGDPGENGITPTIGENGNWHLGETDTGKPSRGEKGDPGQKGDPGAKGDPGPTGATPNIQIGTVQTLDPGQQATASMTGTPENPLLNLGIPKGENTGGGGGTVDPEQIKQAVNSYLEENPVSGMTAEQEQQLNQNTTDVADLKSATNDIQKKIGVAELDVYGLTDDDYEAVDITDLFTPADYNTWNQSSNGNSWTVLSPIFKTPQKLVIINNNTSNILNRNTRFLNGESADSVVFTPDTESFRSDRWASDIPASGTKTIYTHEFGRSGREYMQIRWTNGSFNSWKGKFQVIAYYTDKRPQYEELSDGDGFEHDVDIRWGAAVCGNVRLAAATLLAIVPFIPGRKYTVKGGNWTNSASTNISNAYALYDDSLLNNYYPALASDSGSIPIQPPYRNILSDIVVVESGATNGGKGVVTYTCSDPSETKDYPKWIAFAMANAAKPTVEDTSIVYSYDIEMIQSWINGRISGLDEGRAGWGYVTRFDTLIDRPAKTTDFVNPYEYLNDGSSRYSALQAGSSPLCGARWVIFGDSVNDNFGGDTRDGDGFISKISREFGLIPDNRAQAGSNINDGDESYSNLCGINMLDAFLQEIEEGTTEQPGYITIAYGHNSYGSHVGSADDTSAEHTNSICGAMKYFIEKIREKCPNTVFGFILPYQSDWSKSTAPNEHKDIAAGRKAMLSVLQLEGYQVPYIDMWTQSGITVDMLPDAIHPSSDQAKNLYYHALRRFMMGL